MSETQFAESTRQDIARQEPSRQAPTRQESARQDVTRQDGSRQDSQAMLPRVDVLEDDTGITLFADMPGVSKDSLEINVESDSLLIEGIVSAATPQAMQATYAEVRVPRFRRSFSLSRELDTTGIEAQLKDGVLKLRIPKQKEAQPRRISVNVG
jgi:HSP20 family molecular chaperone IbpA